MNNPENVPADIVGSSECSAESEPLIIKNGTCDGCGNTGVHVQVVNGAPAAGVCLCRGCLEAEPQPNDQAHAPGK